MVCWKIIKRSFPSLIHTHISSDLLLVCFVIILNYWCFLGKRLLGFVVLMWCIHIMQCHWCSAMLPDVTGLFLNYLRFCYLFSYDGKYVLLNIWWRDVKLIILKWTQPFSSSRGHFSALTSLMAWLFDLSSLILICTSSQLMHHCLHLSVSSECFFLTESCVIIVTIQFCACC